jgi:hypothetical protein
MAYLQLAEQHMGNYNMLAEGSVLNNYLTIPPGFMNNEETKFVRLDFFDDLPDEEFALTMAELAPYQPVTLLSAKKGQKKGKRFNRRSKFCGWLYSWRWTGCKQGS